MLKTIEPNKGLQKLNISNNNLNNPQMMQRFEGFCKFIQLNRNLMHLDLSSTFMIADFLTFLINYVKRSQSLLSLHLNDNPISSIQRKYIYTKLKPSKLNHKTIADIDKLASYS